MNRLFALTPLLLAFSCGSTEPVARTELTQGDWIPFDFHNGEHIFVRGMANGHEVDILVDTGAEISIVDRSFAERSGMSKVRALHMIGVGGVADAHLSKGLELSVGNLSIHSASAAIVDLSAFRAAIGHRISVILGIEVFKASIVDIDYPKRRIAFRPVENFRYEGPGNTVEVKPLEKGRYAIEASVEDHDPGWYLIDTGNAFTANVYPRLASRQHLLADRTPTSRWISGGIGGLTLETTASVESFSVGGYELEDMPITIPDDRDGQLADAAFDGLLGNGVLSRFRIIFDYSHDQIHLEPGPGWQTRKFSHNLVGLATVPASDRLEVLFVAPGSPAHLAGWKKGMTIKSVDGHSGTPKELRAKLRVRFMAATGSRVVLVDEDGTERPIVLTRFY